MFNFYYDKRLETKYIKSFFVNTTYEELEDYDSSKDETQRRLERIDSLARADVGYNFHFVPLYFLGNDKGYKPTSVVACILNFWVNGIRILNHPSSEGISLSLKPGKYNFKVEFRICDLLETREYDLDYMEYHQNSTHLRETKVMEVNDYYIDETNDYYLALEIYRKGEFERWSHTRTNRTLYYRFNGWKKEDNFRFVNKENLYKTIDRVDECNHAHHYRLNGDYSSSNYSNGRYNLNSSSRSNQKFNLNTVVNRLSFDDGEYYGETNSSKRYGRGSFKYSNGDYLYGNFINDNCEGYASYFLPSGEHVYGFCTKLKYGFVGECLRFYPDGRMDLVNYNGGLAEGRGMAFYREGAFGPCVYRTNRIVDVDSGDKYINKDNSLEIQSISGTRSYKITKIYTDEGTYCGEVKNGVPHGIGTLNYTYGGRYCGCFKNGKKHGVGTFYMMNGDFVHGHWKDNMYHGQMRFISKNGQAVNKYYENDQHKKEFSFDLSSISSYSTSNNTTKTTSKNDSIGSYNTNKVTNVIKSTTTNTVSKPTQTVSTGPKIVTEKYVDGSSYVGEVNGVGNYEGKGKYISNNGDVYEGEFKSGFKHGQGTLTYSNGDKYVGEFINNMRYGKGTMYFANKSKYVGQFKQNVMDGNGTYYYSDGSTYDGQFVNGKLEGKGTMYYKNGEKYVGEFKGNLNHGEGKYYNKSGKVIKEGKWINGVYQDPNKTVHGYTFENAKIPPEQKAFYYSNYKLISMVKNNRPDLLGTFYYNNGDIYSGVHKNLYKDTFGAYIFKNGRVQVGEYVQDKMCGYCFDYSTNNHFNLAFYDNFVKKGIFYSVSFGQVWIAMCNGDKLIKNIYKGPIKNTMFPGIPTVPISFKYFGDDLYFGELINGKMHGFGKLLLPNQDKYIGYFQNNEFCGVGAYCFSDGSVYLGQFKDSQFHGLGVMINIDKTYDVSIYENGEEIRYLV